MDNENKNVPIVEDNSEIIPKREKKYKNLVKHSKRRNDILSGKELSIIKKESRKFYKLIFFVGVVILSIILVSCMITIYKFFKDINEYAGYISIAVVVLLLLFFVLRPILVALSTPCFTIDAIDNETKKNISRINYKKLKKVASNLLESENISEASKNAIKNSYSNRNDLNDALRDIYDKEISKVISKIITQSTGQVFLSTTISQSNKFDALTVGLVNIRMIMRIVIACGYHPTYPQLYKLIAKVFRNALIAYVIESYDVGSIIYTGINKLVRGALDTFPFIADATKSVTQGAANALLTLRIGIITRKYLYEEFDIQAMLENKEAVQEQILEEAVVEADQNIGTIIKDFKKKEAN